MRTDLATLASQKQSAVWYDYLALCKPRVVTLMILTSVVGMCLATEDAVPWGILLWGNLGIALAAGAAACINHIIEHRIDLLMLRTCKRPVAQGRIATQQALLFAITLAGIAVLILILWVNTLTAILTFISLMGYAIIYTTYLKYATPQNIVIGGLAGAAPPLLGWVAVTGHIDPQGLLLLLIIFIWTPPHFWALAIHRFDDYKNAAIPMLPNTHGIRYTSIHLLLYTVLLTAITLLPFCIRMSSWIYLVGAILLNMGFIVFALRLYITQNKTHAMQTFRYSIWYLMLLFMVLLMDHYFL